MARLLALLALMAAAPGMAHADAKADAQADAQARLSRATELHQAGKIAEALSELTYAYALDPRPEMLYAIGQIQVQLGDCRQAILFYERFLATNPGEAAADAATEAVDTCKRDPGSIALRPAPAGGPLPPPSTAREQPRWYSDKLGAALLGGGVLFGAVSIATYVSARGDLDEADAAPDHATHVDRVDSAHDKRALAVVLGVVGAAFTGAAAWRYVKVRRAGDRPAPAVGLAPLRGGGLVTWSGRFW
jgi:iron complex outermembrane receptor protein